MDPLLFFPMAVLIALTPGPNNLCALNNGIRQGLGAALVATTGRVAAFAIFLTVSAIGLGAMLLASEVAFGAMRWIGAAYLFWLGIGAFRSSNYTGLAAEEGFNSASLRPTKILIMQEFLIGISNPKRRCCCSPPSSRSSLTRRCLLRASSRSWARPTCSRNLSRRPCTGSAACS